MDIVMQILAYLLVLLLGVVVGMRLTVKEYQNRYMRGDDLDLEHLGAEGPAAEPVRLVLRLPAQLGNLYVNLGSTTFYVKRPSGWYRVLTGLQLNRRHLRRRV